MGMQHSIIILHGLRKAFPIEFFLHFTGGFFYHVIHIIEKIIWIFDNETCIPIVFLRSAGKRPIIRHVLLYEILFNGVYILVPPIFVMSVTVSDRICNATNLFSNKDNNLLDVPHLFSFLSLTFSAFLHWWINSITTLCNSRHQIFLVNQVMPPLAGSVMPRSNMVVSPWPPSSGT